MATPEEKQLDVQNKATQELSDIQKPRKVGTKVGLGVIHDDLQKIEKRLEKTAGGQEPKLGREQLPVSLGRFKLDPNNPKYADLLAKIEEADRQQNQPAESPGTTDTGTAADTAESEDQRAERLTRIGSVIQGKIEAERGGKLNTTQTGVNSRVFENFIEETKRRDDLLKDATDDQKDLFQRLEDTLIELREANTEDSEKLRQQIAELGGELKETADTESKAKMQGLIERTQNLAKPPTITGSLGQMVRGNFKAGGAGLIDALAFKNETAIERRRADAPGWAPWRREDKRIEAGTMTGILRQLKGDRPPVDRKPSWQEKPKSGAMPATMIGGDIKPAAPVMPSTVNIENIDTLNVKAKNVTLSGELLDAMNAGGGDSGDTFIDMPDRGKPKGKPRGRPPKVKPSSSWLSRTKSVAQGAWEGTKSVGSKIGMARALTGIGAMLYSSDVGAGSDVVPVAGSEEAEKLEAFRQKQAQEIEQSQAKAKPQSDMVKSSATMLANEAVIPGQPLSKNQMMAAEMSMKSGNTLQPEIQKAYDLTKQQQAKAATRSQGQQIQQQTQVNQDLKKADNKPVVVPVPTPAPAPAGAQGGPSIQLPRGNMRADESAYDRYRNRSAAF